LNQVNPGLSKYVSLVFDVPTDAQGFNLKIPPATGIGQSALLPVPEAPYDIAPKQ
jgi:hypothetical protein